MIDSVIIGKALQQVSRLTIPNFGTLFKKPDGEIVFSQFLSNDDMIFTSLVMNSYKVDVNTAKKMVAEFVTDLEAKINAGGTYLLPELGCLFSDSSGSVKFKKEFFTQQPEPIVPQTPEPEIQQPQVQDISRRTQVTPQPIVGAPQQHPSVVRPSRMQAPLRPCQQQVIPNRNNQSSAQPSRHQPPVQRRPVQQQTPQRPARRPDYREQKKNSKVEKKTDYLLIVAIIVALAVVILIAYSLLSPTELGF